MSLKKVLNSALIAMGISLAFAITFCALDMCSISGIFALLALSLAVILIVKIRELCFPRIFCCITLFCCIILIGFELFLYGVYLRISSDPIPCKDKDKELTSQVLNVNVCRGKYLRRKSDRTIKSGEGNYFSVLKFSNETDLSLQLAVNSEWLSLPMASELEKFFYETDNYFFAENKIRIPQIKNGYYFFLNREGEEKPRDMSELFNDSTYRFSAAIYDSDNLILYFYEIDIR